MIPATGQRIGRLDLPAHARTARSSSWTGRGPPGGRTGWTPSCSPSTCSIHGGDGDRLLAAVDPRHATDLITALTGMFDVQSRLPPPPGIPAVRAFQRAQADALLPWVRDRLMGAAAHPGGPGNSPH